MADSSSVTVRVRGGVTAGDGAPALTAVTGDGGTYSAPAARYAGLGSFVADAMRRIYPEDAHRTSWRVREDAGPDGVVFTATPFPKVRAAIRPQRGGAQD